MAFDAHTVKVSDASMLHQWVRVLRLQSGSQVRLFNSEKEERLCVIDRLDTLAAQLTVKDIVEPLIPEAEVYLCFSLLKKDKNTWVMQKATELGVSGFVPLVSKRTEKTGFDVERAHKIVVEASEQCGRSDVPTIHGPAALVDVLSDMKARTQVYIAEQGARGVGQKAAEPVSIFVGPEGGWTEEEQALFEREGVELISLGAFTLRAETASVAAATLLC